MSRSDASTPTTDSLKVTLICDNSSSTPPGEGSIKVTVGAAPCAAAGHGPTSIAARVRSHIFLRHGRFIAAIGTDRFYDCPVLLARRLAGLSAGNKNVRAGSHLVLSGSATDIYQNRMRMASPIFIFVAAAIEVEEGRRP